MKDHVPGKDPIPLTDANLPRLSKSLKVPSYDRASLSPGIVHIGLGNFHRAHQAYYLHCLMEKGLARDWAIIGAGVRSADTAMRDRLLSQDCLTTLIELDPAGTSAEIIGPMIDFLPVETGNGSLIKAMSDPAIRIVSLTVTEGGYFLDAEGHLNTAHPDIRHDATHPDAPITAFGAIVAALKARRAAGLAPFTGQCCDNLQDNGAILRQTIVGLARLSDTDLADWIDANMCFPNAMVDCIVPATGQAERDLARDLGIADAAPVTHENFRQWVIEDSFSAGRPPWEEVDVTMTDDVHPYESMKIRILNAGHQVLANAGELLGLETIGDCMTDGRVLGLFRKVQTTEMLPHVDAVPGMTPESYLDLVERRFSNPKIRDTTRRVAFDGSSRHTGFVLPILRDALAAGASIEGLALVEALWARMCAGTREDGSVIEANDPHWDTLNTTAKATKDDPMAWLRQSQFYGDLADDDRFAKAFVTWLEQLWTNGVDRTLATYLD